MEKVPSFIPGLDLNRMFFQQVIRPLMDTHFSDVKYSYGILGEGSDVVRYDTPQSMDHNWGPRGQLFLSDTDFIEKRDEIDKMFRRELPFEFMGFPTNFTKADEKSYLVQQMKHTDRRPINHLIHFHSIKSFFNHYLGYDPNKRISYKDWLTFPNSALIEVTKGEVFYDGLGELNKAREKLSYYPEDVWLYMYMVQWGKIANIEALMGRSGEVGDELGSNIIATNIVTDIMGLCFLMEKQYIPYIKWFGTGFSRLRCANELTHLLLDVVHGRTWPEREECLARVYEVIIRMHNDLKITKPFGVETQEFEGRPYKVIYANRVFEAIKEKVRPTFRNFKYDIGAINQFMNHNRLTRANYIWRELTKMIK